MFIIISTIIFNSKKSMEKVGENSVIFSIQKKKKKKKYINGKLANFKWILTNLISVEFI